MSTITVVNVRNQQQGPAGAKYVYVGRKCGKYDASPLGNPFHLTVDTPEERKKVVAQYADWLDLQMRNPASPARKEIERLAALVKDGHDLYLGCWCAPKACHGWVVANTVGDLVMTWEAREEQNAYAHLQCEWTLNYDRHLSDALIDF